jgi:hypothetical protein
MVLSTRGSMDINTSVKNKEALMPFSIAASRYVQGLMAQHGISYATLKLRLEGLGVDYSESNLRNKVTKFMLRADLFFMIVFAIKGNLHTDNKVLEEALSSLMPKSE